MPKLSYAFLTVLLLLGLPACDGGSAPVDGGGVLGADAPSATLGTCSFVLVDGATRTNWEGSGRARMNGTGNLLVQCDPVVSDGSGIELNIGNATFDGPRRYNMDDFSDDGSIRYDPGTSGTYISRGAGGGCVLDLAEAAPLNAARDTVQRGGRVGGTFSCTAIVATLGGLTPQTYAVESGTFSANVE